ncbi:branched-chain amino acid ABC transporter permease [Alteribacillus iranensis]|uniref:Amino acid/amide ABC transporter membrane protein 2, HAAT family n=1 Tax=Alteribacillus iranensis TaxID=930128 RepID=A0A1I2F1Y2_9BACI|nr:branched-chain amino acid ABC transporter permease [Alteribacillus iranensis]SFE98718.1 amino acid/amide ABC transporter membrane protein 2, HAAT family [Alteribacillus iranensis]
MKRIILSTIGLMAAVLFIPVVASPYVIYLSTEVLIMAIFAMSLGLIMGFGGMPSLGHSALFGLGAYTVVALSQYVSNVYVLLGAALILTLIFSLITGFIAMRNTGIFFLMVTLAFTQVLYLISSGMNLWGGADGMSTMVRANFGFGNIASSTGLFYMIGVFFVLSYFLLKVYTSSPMGKILKGVMENESRMTALGFNPKIFKTAAYTLAGGMAGIAGALYIYKNQFVSPELFSVHTAAEAMIMVFIGGYGTIFGPALGAGAFVFIENYVSSFTDRWSLILGLIFIAIVMLKRGGIIHLLSLAWNSIVRMRKKMFSERKRNVVEVKEEEEMVNERITKSQ